MKQLKKKVYDANMALYHSGLVLYTWGNVSEIHREKGLVAIKPSGVPYDKMKEEDIAVVSLATGEQVEGALYPSSDAPTHLVLYRAFPSIQGITHTHSRHATAYAQAGRPLPCYGTTHADTFHGTIPITRALTQEEVNRDYETETGHVIVEALQTLSAAEIGAVLVRHHGPFTFAKSAMASVENAVILEEIAAIALLSGALAGIPEEAPAHLVHKHYFRKHGTSAYYGQEK